MDLELCHFVNIMSKRGSSRNVSSIVVDVLKSAFEVDQVLKGNLESLIERKGIATNLMLKLFLSF